MLTISLKLTRAEYRILQDVVQLGGFANVESVTRAALFLYASRQYDLDVPAEAFPLERVGDQNRRRLGTYKRSS